MDKSSKTDQIISVLMREAHHSMDHEHFEDAVIKLQRCLQLNDEPSWRTGILDDLGYCYLKLGWFEEAVNAYTEYPKILPSDNDERFFLASAYASLKWTKDAIQELRTLLASDPNDVLARHDLALCYRTMGWKKESLEEMKIANARATAYGNPEEQKIVKNSLSNLEYEIENGDDDGSKDALLFLILLTVISKRRKLKLQKPTKEQI